MATLSNASIQEPEKNMMLAGICETPRKENAQTVTEGICSDSSEHTGKQFSVTGKGDKYSDLKTFGVSSGNRSVKGVKRTYDHPQTILYERNKKSLSSSDIRQANTFIKEATLAMNFIQKNKIELRNEDSEKIKNVINKTGKELMNNHRYLSVISGKGIRSRGYRKGKHEFIREVCIVLYVQEKGRIPSDETEFPKFLDGIPVDVIEGEFQTCALSTKFQDSLRIGSQIQSGASLGTLGGFVEHPQYGLSAITCAHVVLGDAELHDLQRNGECYLNSSTKNVYQPDCADEKKNYIGKVKEVRYKSGGNGIPGVDLAVIQVEKRPPKNGKVPDAINMLTDQVDFETGQALFSLNENYNYVVKFGRTTGETSGEVQFSNAAVKPIEHEHRYQLSDGVHTYRLFNQFEISCSSGCFADRGDSGSLVFKKDVSGNFVCIGMVVGCITSSGNGIVTPISAILSELGVKGFKDFRLNRVEERLSNIETSLSNIEKKLSL